MLRITKLAEDDKKMRLKVEGRLVGDWVPELDRVCTDYISTNKKVSLDLSDMSFIDGKGVDVLRKLSGNGLQIIGASLWVQSLLGVWGSELV